MSTRREALVMECPPPEKIYVKQIIEGGALSIMLSACYCSKPRYRCAENYEWLWRRVVYFSDDYEQKNTCFRTQTEIFKSGRVLVSEGSLILFYNKLKKTSFLIQRYHRWLQLTAFSGVRWNRQYGIIKKKTVKLAGVAGYTKQILYFKNR